MSILLKLSIPLTNTFKTSSTYLSRRSIRTSLICWHQRLGQSANSLQIEKKYLLKDKVPPQYQLIYRAPMESYVIWSMHVSTLSASAISAAALYQFTSNKPLVDPMDIPDMKLIMHSEDLYYFALGFLAINTVVRFVISKFPLRIYKDNEKYMAVFQSQLPGGISHHHFNKGEVKAVSYTFSPWNNATFKLGNKTCLLLDDYFKTPSEFEIMSKTKEDQSFQLK